jgi:quinol monooxygenase YgiN
MRRMIGMSALLVLLGLAIQRPRPTPVRAEDPDGLLCVVTHVDVLPKFTADGRELFRRFAADSRKDAGAFRVEVFEELARPNHSTIVEMWETRKAYDDHLAADHTRAYRARLQPLLGSPFDERLHRPVR